MKTLTINEINRIGEAVMEAVAKCLPVSIELESEWKYYRKTNSFKIHLKFR